MEQKFVRIPFDVELAKKITNGEVKGRVFDNYYKCYVRIVDFNFHSSKGKFNVAISERGKGKEVYSVFNDEGIIYLDREDKLDEKPVFMLEVPDYVIYQDGDVIVTGWEENGESSKWISIVKSIKVYDDGVTTSDYVTLIVTSNNHTDGVIKYDDYTTSGKWTRKVTEEERRMIIDKLKEDKDFRAVKYLKKFFPDEVKTEFKDGDIIAYDDNDSIVVLKGEPIINDDGFTSFNFYVDMYKNDLNFYTKKVSLCVNGARKATPEEIQKLKDRLGKDDRLEAQEYLKRFFGVEQKKEHEFKPFDKVLVRDSDSEVWNADFFSHATDGGFVCVGALWNHCIPYNEQTKHLLGTTGNWE